MPLLPSASRTRCWIALVWCAFAASRVLAEPTPTPDPHLEKAKAFAQRLVDAPDDDARRRLLADAPPDLRDDETMRRQFNLQAFEPVRTGDFARADGLSVFARRWCEEHGDRLGMALADWSRGNLEGTRGNYREAAKYFAVARQFFVESGDHRREAMVLSNQSILALQFGDYRQALAGLENALVIHREAKNHDAIADTLQTMGNVYSAQGQIERSVDYFQQALAEAGNNEDTREGLFANLGLARAALDDVPGAVDQLEKALALARKLHDEASESVNLSYLARVREENNQSDEAARLYRQSLALAEKVGQKERTAADLSGLAELLAYRPGKPDDGSEALSFADRAVALAREIGDSEQIIRACTVRGRLLRLAGKFDEARAALAEAIDNVEDTREHLAGGDTAALAFFDRRLEPYQETVALLVDRNLPLEALAFAERARARVLLETLRGGAHSRFDEALTPAERAALRQRTDAVTALNRELTAATPVTRAGVAEKLRQARRAREDAEDTALNAHPELRRYVPARKQDAALTPAAVNSLLAGGGVLVEYSVGQDETLAFLVRRTAGNGSPSTEAFRLPLGRKELEKRTRHYRRLLADRGLDWEHEARTLGDDLLGPLRPALADEKRLVIVPDGPLWEMPFQTLPTARGNGALAAGDTLAAKKLSFAPSLGFLLQARGQDALQAGSPKHGTRLLAFGNPTVGQSPAAANRTALRDDEWLPLPDAEREVLALGKLYGPAQSEVLVGAAATEGAFRRDASRCDVLHFATHGVFNNQSPLYSHLLLAQTNLASDEDGLLEAWELMRQPLHARLAVLSACETARGQIGAGEGVIGLSWALFAAGCPSCVVSQWKVDSAGSTDLMVEFHRQLIAGSGRAEALQRARLRLAANPETDHPFYWAPFVLIGEGD